MNIEVRAKERTQKSKLSIIDCDFHPRMTHEQMKPFLSNQWWSYLQTYGNRQRHGQAKGYNYPKIAPQASRRDAWPPNGGPPGSDLDFCREQHLDFYGIDHAILTPLGSSSPPATATRTSNCRLRSRPPRTKASLPIGPTRSRG